MNNINQSPSYRIPCRAQAAYHSMGAIPWWLPQQCGGIEQEEVSGVRDMD